MALLISKVEAAKMFGASVQGVTAWIRQGMPSVTEVKKGRKTGKVGRPRTMIEPEAARAWLIEKGVRTFLKSELRHAKEAEALRAAAPRAGSPTTQDGAGGASAVVPPVAASAPAAAVPGASSPQQMNVSPGVDGALDRLRGIELRAFSDYVRARNAGDVLSQRAHMKLHSEAVRRMLEAEAELDHRREVLAQVWTEVEGALAAWAAPVRSLIDNMPRTLAAQCNASDPKTAETVLRAWVHEQLFPMLNRKPTP